MKATDLMIGDWVMSDNELLKVSDILRYRIYAHDAVGYYPIEDLEPILLTGEILKSNGFELVSDSDRVTKAFIDLYDLWECEIISQQTLRLFYDRNSKDYRLQAFGDNISNIYFVHELQHAMRVCGVKKEIELCQH